MAEQTVWKKAVETVELADTGDILTPLKRVLTQYMARAAKHTEAGRTEQAEYYYEQVKNVGELIAQ